MMDRYLPIAEHGLTGNLRTAAQVITDGTIDWFWCPRSDASACRVAAGQGSPRITRQPLGDSRASSRTASIAAHSGALPCSASRS